MPLSEPSLGLTGSAALTHGRFLRIKPVLTEPGQSANEHRANDQHEDALGELVVAR
jgi:hypothetical protein